MASLRQAIRGKNRVDHSTEMMRLAIFRHRHRAGWNFRRELGHSIAMLPPAHNQVTAVVQPQHAATILAKFDPEN